MIDIFRKRSLGWGCVTTVAIAVGLFSCENDEAPSYKTQSAELNLADPYLQIQTPVIGFQAGTASYPIEVNVINGVISVQTLNIYKTFNDTEGHKSNEALLGTYTIGSGPRSVIEDDITYDELKQGLTINGSSLPTDEIDLAVGAGWTLRLEGMNAAGQVVPLNGGGITVAVLSPYAGIYEYTNLEYWRIGVFRDDITGPSIGAHVFIGSVDENTFAHNDWWGPFGDWTGYHFEFDVDFENPIAPNVYPIVNFQFPDGIYAGISALTCAANGASLPRVDCNASNRLIVDPVNNQHKFILSYGYAAADGNREFFNEMVKVNE